jgi:hypothetical protein
MYEVGSVTAASGGIERLTSAILEYTMYVYP